MEEVASKYFSQLIESSMLEPVVSNFTGDVVSCRVHDVVRMLALSMYEGGFGIFDVLPVDRVMQTRSLAIHNIADVSVAQNEPMKARALFVLRNCNLDRLLSALIFLRVLCLDGASIEHLPDQAGDLFYLIYLGLRNTLINDLPSSLGRLHNLETLMSEVQRFKPSHLA